MTTGKWIGATIITLLLTGLVADAVRYLKPAPEKKTVVQPQQANPLPGANKIIMVYNANGGIYPGIADILHKSFFPKTYPCNLCFLAFGDFGKKEGWKDFLATVPYKKTELHKDEFRRNYLPNDLPLPTILISNGTETRVMVSAAEINAQHTLPDLIALVQSKLR